MSVPFYPLGISNWGWTNMAVSIVLVVFRLSVVVERLISIIPLRSG